MRNEKRKKNTRLYIRVYIYIKRSEKTLYLYIPRRRVNDYSSATISERLLLLVRDRQSTYSFRLVSNEIKHL